MGFKEVQTLDADVTISIGGKNKKTGKANPTKAEGYFLGTRQVKSPKAKNGLAALHFFSTPKGNLGVWGKTDMDRKLATATPGMMVRVSFEKMVPTPNGDMYKYKVEVDETNTIEVAAPEEAPSYEASGDDDDTESYSSSDEEDAGEETNDEDGSDYEAEEAAANAALAALERKKKVQELMGKGKTKTASKN